MKTAIILGITSDIGRALGERLLRDEWYVVGMASRTIERVKDWDHPNLVLTNDMALSVVPAWDLLISAVGTQQPIGPFFDVDFDEWEDSVDTNFVAQVRFLHDGWPRRRQDAVDIMFFAGGGTNQAFVNYSAYCVSKIALIKMAEQIHAETKEANCFVIGPGYVKTRIHDETLKAGPEHAGANYARTVEQLKGEGTSMDDIYAHMRWCMAQGREVAGGRNFSTVHDPWRNGGEALAHDLRNDPDFYRLRRQQVPL